MQYPMLKKMDLHTEDNTCIVKVRTCTKYTCSLLRRRADLLFKHNCLFAKTPRLCY